MSYFLPESDAVLTACRGLATAHPGILVLNEDPLYLRAIAPDPRRTVALVSGGGSGHDPLHTGLLGRGGLDAVAPGAVFASPHNRQVYEASRAVVREQGVLHIVKNYTGDRINFGIAAERLRTAGVPVEQVLVDDDIATDGTGAGRRGTAATVVVEKLLGAAADEGAGLDELAELGREIVARSRSLAVCTRAHTSPGLRTPAFALRPDHIDYGVGIHGERGIRTLPMPRAETLVTQMLGDLTQGAAPAPDGVLLIVNGLGATSLLELQALTDIAVEYLAEDGTHVAAVLTGSHVGALDMAGVSLTITGLRPGWLPLWQATARTPLTSWPQATALPRPLPSPNAAPEDPEPPAAGSRALLDRYSEIIRTVRPALTLLDQLAGDGDFGDNLAGGLARATLRARTTGEDGMTAAASVFLDDVGGTSGPLFGLLFQHLAAATAASPTGARPPVRVLADALSAGTDAIRRVGGAGIGDRTMVDALAPAVRSLRAPAADKSAVSDAARAAVTGARTTAELLGARGRSSYLGARVLGNPDPGAIGVALLLLAAADVYEPVTAAKLPAPGHVTRTASTPPAA
ncbi:dihydroxyacetone kinase family protein [Streptomyces olivaceus]|uniref:dihydroxyacetone kinase subunit DhaK n=1 Tax=Streptomyces olivaceus TaxID=47716 RepID=UPI0022EE4FA4|nr:dihydroxyacetone kinase subunit DhaK [Streptomyces olivaceus]GHI98159.1 dihydroxyacetone kinase family protein [Streptomyces olivaceus]